MNIDAKLIRRLIDSQFPQWSDLAIKPVKRGGNDNRTFHLGDQMSVRLPSAESYEPQVEKEQKWLPQLQNGLPLTISMPIAKGEPGEGYPWKWSVCRWVDGDTANDDNITDMARFAVDLAHFLKALQSIDSSGGPVAGPHNFYRGGSLNIYNEETLEALHVLNDSLKANKTILEEIWKRSLSTKWQAQPVWVHGDVTPANLIVNDGRLTGVIDFGILGIGDPACDLTMAWTYFPKDIRNKFTNAFDYEESVWQRAQGWALWKALITWAHSDDHEQIEQAKKVIGELISDHNEAF